MEAQPLPVDLTVHAPRKFYSSYKIANHIIRHIAQEACEVSGSVQIEAVGRTAWRTTLPNGVCLTSNTKYAPDSDPSLITDLSLTEAMTTQVVPEHRVKWRYPGNGTLPAIEVRRTITRDVRDSWTERFKFRVESDETPGLRTPQIGALHALLSKWTVSDNVTTVVLPTGTGKTDTMISALVCERLSPLLVVVPSLTLKKQLSDGFASLGVLKSVGALDDQGKYPVVGTINGRIRTADDLEELLDSCNVLVSTMASLTRCGPDVHDLLSQRVSRIFVDEAHHVGAPTWADFITKFPPSKVTQFTATPFRGDGKPVSGQLAYRYPLKKAQEAGYFAKIYLQHVHEHDPRQSDLAIARVAVSQLEADLADDKNHILMARTSSITRAEEVGDIYRSITDLPITVVHSQLSPSEQAKRKQLLLSHQVRIVVCVDMLGEGYDQPSLKIAALHDAHRGLGIALQFIGRFTRVVSGIGDATVVANIADDRIRDELESLYSEDADWNTLIERLAEGAMGRYLRRIEFLEEFDDLTGEVPIQNIQPKMSTEVYRVADDKWRPDNLIQEFDGEQLFFYSVNRASNVAVIVSRNLQRVDWGDVASIRDVVYELTLLYFDRNQSLLFIHSSETKSYRTDLAKAVVEREPVRIQGIEVFRALHGINRLLVANLGLRHSIGRSIRYTMYAGVDVNDGLTEQNFANKMTSNMFGFGYEDGERASIGCSYRGRLWAYRISEDISEWTQWCRAVGAKLSDSRIDPGSFLRTTMRAEIVDSRPVGIFPISAEWSENIWARPENLTLFTFGSFQVSLIDVGIDLVDPSEAGPIYIRVNTTDTEAIFELVLTKGEPSYRQISGPKVNVKQGRTVLPIENWFVMEPPIVRFHDGQQLSGSILISAPEVTRPFNVDQIETWDWSTANLRAESQGANKDPKSIQRHVIEHLLAQEYDLVIDDDGTNEMADVVAIRSSPDKVEIHMYHCKWAIDGKKGARIKDLYEVCGQAQKSVHWKGDRKLIYKHIAHRESIRLGRGENSRFEKGSLELLATTLRRMRDVDVAFEITIVQPGLEKGRISDDQRDLLATTQLYLSETYAVPLRVISSE